jgi:hypothetical protein
MMVIDDVPQLLRKLGTATGNRILTQAPETGFTAEGVAPANEKLASFRTAPMARRRDLSFLLVLLS